MVAENEQTVVFNIGARTDEEILEVKVLNLAQILVITNRRVVLVDGEAK